MLVLFDFDIVCHICDSQTSITFFEIFTQDNTRVISCLNFQLDQIS